MNKWKDAYPELVNKLRWAISTAFATGDSRYPYGVAQKIATVYAEEILQLVKLAEEEPGAVGSTDIIRQFSLQREVDRELDRT